MKAKNIIQRRDLEPVWHKANEIVRHYEKASDCITAVLGADCVGAELSKHPKANFFCLLCKQYNSEGLSLEPYECPCSAMHRDVARNARKQGGLVIYTCPLGFYFWSSPFFARERFAGAFISSVIPSEEKQQIVDKIYKLCRKDISRAEIVRSLEDVPEKNSDEIKILARLMMLCTDYVTCSGSQSVIAESEGMSWSYQPDIMEYERQLIASLRRGDSAEVREIVWNLLSNLYNACGGNFEIFKYRVIELIVVLSRSAPENNEELVESTNRYLKRLEELSSAEEVFENLCVIIEMIAGKIFSFRGVRHASALRKAERFIRENFTRKISLKEIADISDLSAPYFSTIFKNEMGENLSNYLNRIRIEKATAMLRETDFPIGEISATCGFEDQSWFSKIFKIYTGVSPCRYRELGSALADQDFPAAQEM